MGVPPSGPRWRQRPGPARWGRASSHCPPPQAGGRLRPHSPLGPSVPQTVPYPLPGRGEPPRTAATRGDFCDSPDSPRLAANLVLASALIGSVPVHASLGPGTFSLPALSIRWCLPPADVGVGLTADVVFDGWAARPRPASATAGAHRVHRCPGRVEDLPAQVRFLARRLPWSSLSDRALTNRRHATWDKDGLVVVRGSRA